MCDMGLIARLCSRITYLCLITLGSGWDETSLALHGCHSPSAYHSHPIRYLCPFAAEDVLLFGYTAVRVSCTPLIVKLAAGA